MADENNDEMPVPPDLTSLFQQQTQQINEACENASQAFAVFKSRDSAVASLTQSLNSEVNEVFMMAAAAKTPQLAMATIPPVLALANMTFAKVPVTDQKTVSEIQQAFAPFGK
ncbi:hypothetical protein J0X12_05555 [Sneathiella sp. CAU 1612]|jgi:hypothetical protein|uniref:Phasin domain-containing protein n=1 Tax=Sneathiella sedimenti TaxID=2816034 RepID=A0ABS3F3G9_9PROT|nr:hypothetical protein [Sneathiella sedimenti]MBO0333066.1 hypothetical protein [Sneathiella sedimenti]